VEGFLVALLTYRLPSMIVPAGTLTLPAMKTISMLMKASVHRMKIIKINFTTPLTTLLPDAPGRTRFTVNLVLVNYVRKIRGLLLAVCCLFE
jgi:hypothetical protein